jgi:hypothetical protein
MRAAREKKILARQLATECLKDAGYEPEACRSVRLVPVRRVLLVKQVHRLTGLSAREGAILPLEPQLSLWHADEAKVIVGGKGITLRFTYAHELAHWAARLRLPEEECAKWSADEVRQFCDEFAGRLLVPDELLISSLRETSVDPNRAFQISIPMVESIYRHVQAPMATILKRIGDAVEEGRLRITNCAMLVCAGRSAKRNTDYATRILACCTPLQWFLPANKRLMTLGMSNLDQAFWKAPPIRLGFVVDKFTVWSREGWQRESVQRPISYKIYAAGKSQHASRVMLSLFPGPH